MEAEAGVTFEGASKLRRNGAGSDRALGYAPVEPAPDDRSLDSRRRKASRVDLTKSTPQSPYAKTGHIVFVPRTLDKVRAEIAGTLGEYHWRVGMSMRLLDFLEIEAEELLRAVEEEEDDKAVWDRVRDKAKPRSKIEIAGFNESMIEGHPETEEQRSRHRDFVAGAGVTDDLEAVAEEMTIFERLELDDGRETEMGGGEMDLTTGIPRSPYERMLGMVFLPRTIDKARAELAGKEGEYLFRTGYSASGMEVLGISPEQLFEALRGHSTDEDIRGWIADKRESRTDLEIAKFNREAIERRANTPEQIEWHRNYLTGIGLAELADIVTSVERLEWDEGR